MYCENCGKKLNENGNYCANCGEKINNLSILNEKNSESTENIRIASIVLGGLSLGGALLFILAPVSFILGIIGLILAIKSHRNGNNVVGIVLNAIGIFLSIIILGIISLMIRVTVNAIKYGTDWYDNNIYDYLERQYETGREDKYE